MQRIEACVWLPVVPRSLIVLGCLMALTAGGCGGKQIAERTDLADLQGLALPLDVREVQLARADGNRGVFLRLSRLPEGIHHRAMGDPARLVLEIKGPTGTQGEEDLPGTDDLVSRLRVQRDFGVLRVLVDLRGEEVPEYSVHAMADWIMIRFKSPRSG